MVPVLTFGMMQGTRGSKMVIVLFKLLLHIFWITLILQQKGKMLLTDKLQVITIPQSFLHTFYKYM